MPGAIVLDDLDAIEPAAVQSLDEGVASHPERPRREPAQRIGDAELAVPVAGHALEDSLDAVPRLRSASTQHTQQPAS